MVTHGTESSDHKSEVTLIVNMGTEASMGLGEVSYFKKIFKNMLQFKQPVDNLFH